MILLIDNYDSFTYNLYQYMSELGEDVKVVRNDAVTLEEIKAMRPEAIVLSPGPGTPKDSGICLDVIGSLGDVYPILGICLGHQAITEVFGGVVSHAKRVMHGKQSVIVHHQKDLFNGLPKEIDVMRYHSLVALEEHFPDCLEITARALDDGEIMALKHKTLPIYGMQFHPESIGTVAGHTLLENFFKTVRKGAS
ncbi:aminodeoxychorismate/anthranilate synthase component II [Halolactibacillus alkaliphilus]|uniref:Aminodeoxychorismate/anthranilate synthase component II n=1 Tax=Halolactibacillus alkaliphilus TaxID=442899 RepID=A0A511X3N6_9BACI|nr:aminodeoxychorismate/anthranilate synthase component II [Halolactibacillus alkaliphilus]GEN57562.1 aminodeoxychorismate/anthranilate synthase component II [Halolactibacillus alkaliphilus]GGN73335.1 aminodeoxychorismate/anthranilate synthase component II [Halolactibacillus alkaliphilus]SFO96280.1 anthranilate synthase component 2 [Halolactibacillus alkaliphilus]